MRFYALDTGGSPDLELSIVIPVRDEAASIPSLAREIDAAMAATDIGWEAVWVDDGSGDDTPRVLELLACERPHHRFLRLEQGRGQSAALAAGFDSARGTWVSTMDGDGQNVPADIPLLLEEQRRTGAHVVNGWRRERADNTIRRFSSRIANGFRNRVTGESVRDVGCSIRLIRREALDGIPVFAGMHRFLPTLIRMNGWDHVVEVPVRHRARRRGVTKYGIQNRLWVGLFDTFAIVWMRRRLVPATGVGRPGAVAASPGPADTPDALSHDPAGGEPSDAATRTRGLVGKALQPR